MRSLRTIFDLPSTCSRREGKRFKNEENNGYNPAK
jgi:hypothetical protein